MCWFERIYRQYTGFDLLHLEDAAVRRDVVVAAIQPDGSKEIGKSIHFAWNMHKDAILRVSSARPASWIRYVAVAGRHGIRASHNSFRVINRHELRVTVATCFHK